MGGKRRERRAGKERARLEEGRRESSNTDFRRSVEARDEVWSRLAFVERARGSEVGQLYDQLVVRYEDVVRLDVRVNQRTPTQQTQREQQLLRIRTHRLHVEAHSATVLVQQLAQIHAAHKGTRAHHTQFINLESFFMLCSE